jgi:16S rRNA (uracil1498-N3)-methyltransferase
MSLPRFFLEHQILGQQTDAIFLLDLAPDDAKHARVLRLVPGEHIAVIDASSDYFECVIQEASVEGLFVSIARHVEESEPSARITLVQGLAKGDKFETVVRHATEVGVSRFVPLACTRSVVKLDAKKASSRQTRWQALAKSAAMQSGQPAIPQVDLPCTVAEFAQELRRNVPLYTGVFICWEEAPATCGLSDAVASVVVAAHFENAPGEDEDSRKEDESSRKEEASHIETSLPHFALVVGPEGGLTEHEVETLLQAHPRARLVTLGPSILRTETAGIVAPALLRYELGGMGRFSSEHPQNNEG